MTKKLAIVAFLAVSLTSAFAQQAGPAGGTAATPPPAGKVDRAKMMQDIIDQLTLTADQKKKYDDLVATYKGKMKDARKETKGDKEAWKAKNRELRKDEEKELDAILTTDQQKKYKELRKELAKKLRDERGESKPGN